MIVREFFHEDMVLYSINTCTDILGHVRALEFSLSTSRHLEPGAVKFKLDPIGQLTGRCEDRHLSGPIESIVASYDPIRGVNGIRYVRGS